VAFDLHAVVPVLSRTPAVLDVLLRDLPSDWVSGTLTQHLATWVVHDLDHLSQIARVMGRQYTDAVGPWRQYLRIVGPA
jgi:hypothetical protein